MGSFNFLIRQFRIHMGERLCDICILTAWGGFYFTALSFLNTKEFVVKLFYREPSLNGAMSTWMSLLQVRMYKSCYISLVHTFLWKSVLKHLCSWGLWPQQLFLFAVIINTSASFYSHEAKDGSCLSTVRAWITNLGFKHAKHLWWDQLESGLQPGSCPAAALG